ncbi:hypothetical protein NVP1121O_160 [Vibrio phage 1.121.O._10N.286.46.C4]|nr:hypothetical protein NVP1121O_160 [Vibrio phage 1.121.O._10N.286.46.C4]
MVATLQALIIKYGMVPEGTTGYSLEDDFNHFHWVDQKEDCIFIPEKTSNWEPEIPEDSVITRLTPEEQKYISGLRKGVVCLAPESYSRDTAAKNTLEDLGYSWEGGSLWKPPLGTKPDYIGEYDYVLKTFNSITELAEAYESTGLWFKSGSNPSYTQYCTKTLGNTIQVAPPIKAYVRKERTERNHNIQLMAAIIKGRAIDDVVLGELFDAGFKVT